MTTHYIDIVIRHSAEMSVNQLMNDLMDKLHQRLAGRVNSDIGVSFPRYTMRPRSMGDHMRLHGTEEALRDLMAENWLFALVDHTRILGPAMAPADAAHCQVVRRQPKASVERRRRRYVRRTGASAEQAATAIPDAAESRLDLPFVQMRSRTSLQPFYLFVDHVPVVEPQSGVFSTYGLGGASVPWF